MGTYTIHIANTELRRITLTQAVLIVPCGIEIPQPAGAKQPGTVLIVPCGIEILRRLHGRLPVGQS